MFTAPATKFNLTTRAENHHIDWFKALTVLSTRDWALCLSSPPTQTLATLFHIRICPPAATLPYTEAVQKINILKQS